MFKAFYKLKDSTYSTTSNGKCLSLEKLNVYVGFEAVTSLKVYVDLIHVIVKVFWKRLEDICQS